MTAIKGVIPAPPAKAPSFATLAEQNCQALSDEIAKVKEKATALDEALALLEPGKKGEKVESVSLETTLHAWAPVPGKFDDFEREIDALRTLMNDTTSAGYDSTCGDIKTANDLILINYRNARKAFLAVDALVNSSQVVAYPYEVDSSNAHMKSIRVTPMKSTLTSFTTDSRLMRRLRSIASAPGTSRSLRPPVL